MLNCTRQQLRRLGIRRVGDLVGRRVRMRCGNRTVGLRAVAIGDVLAVRRHWRGLLVLNPCDGRRDRVEHVPLWDVELAELRGASEETTCDT